MNEALIAKVDRLSYSCGEQRIRTASCSRTGTAPASSQKYVEMVACIDDVVADCSDMCCVAKGNMLEEPFLASTV